MRSVSPCEHCEKILQPYIDRELTEDERRAAESHLDECGFCRKAYRFEESLRRYVRTTCSETMGPELKARLAELRTPLF
jgi:anti-sigma factor (TIGR02949 family)